MQKQKYIETILFLYLNLFHACDVYQLRCVPTFAAYISEFFLSYFYRGSKWSNIFYQYDGNRVLKIISSLKPCK